MDVESAGDQVQLREPRRADGVLVPLDGSPVEAGRFGEVVLGVALFSSECGDPVPKLSAAGEDPVGQGCTAAGHSTNRRALPIMSQYQSCRLLAG